MLELMGMIKNKRPWLFGIITIFLCFCLYLLIGNLNYRNGALAASHKKVKIDELFKDLGCQWAQTHINAWAVIETGNKTFDDLKNIGLVLCDFLNLEDNREITTNYDNHQKQVKIRTGDQKGLKYDIIIMNSEKTHIVINIYNDQHFVGTQELIDKIEDYFHSIKALPRISAILAGTFDGRLDSKERKSIINSLVRKIDGQVTQTMEDERLISIAGYSYILDVAPIGNINFQIASRYNAYEAKTYIWAGTPIITIEY